MDSPSTSDDRSTVRRRSRRRLLLVGLLILAIGFVLAPWVVSKTGWRNDILQAVVDNPNVQVESSAASFGWFSPLSVENLQLKSRDGTSSVVVERLDAQESWLSMWMNDRDLGRFELDRPQIEVLIGADADEQIDDLDQTDLPNLTAVITDGEFIVRREGRDDPVVNLTGVNMTIGIDNAEKGPMLFIDRLKIFDRRELTPEVCSRGLQLIAPILAGEITVSGKLSFELERLRAPLYRQPDNSHRLDLEVSGVVVLHEVSGRITNDITRRLVMLAAELLEIHELPDRIVVTDETTIQFELRDGRLHHVGTAVVLPDIAPEFSIQTSGSVGFDDDLSLTVAINIPAKLMSDTPLSKKLTASPVLLRVTGTFDEPRIGLPVDQTWITELADHVLSDELTGEEAKQADRILDLIAKLLEENDGTPVQIPDRFLDRLKQVRQSGNN